MGFRVAALVHAVRHGECPHIFEPEVSDCAAWRGTSDLVDSYGRFRNALQCCREVNTRAFSTGDTCVDRHTGHQQQSLSPHEARNTSTWMPLKNAGLLSHQNSRVQPQKEFRSVIRAHRVRGVFGLDADSDVCHSERGREQRRTALNSL